MATAIEKFFKVILAHEAGTPDDCNWYIGDGTKNLRSYLKGSSKKKYPFFTKDLSQYTIGEIKAFMKKPRTSDGGQLWATGKYQIIPNTLDGLTKDLGMKDNVKYDLTAQDALGLQLLLNRSPIKKFLQGKSDDVQKAALSIAQIWSSVGVPYAVKGSKKQVVKDESYYSGGGDVARTKTDDVQKALIELRKSYSGKPFTGTFNTGTPESTTGTTTGTTGTTGTTTGTTGTTGSAGSSGTSGVTRVVPKITLKKKSGPGEIIGITEKEVYFNETTFRGLQFEKPGDYVISVIPSTPDIEPTEWKITVKPDPNAPQEPRATEDEKIEGSRPIITQIDKPSYKLDAIEWKTSPDQQENREIASSIGYTPFMWFMGYQIPPGSISALNLYHDGIVPKVMVIFRDTMGFIKKEGMPLDNSKFEVFLNSGSENLKSIHLRFKIVKFQENKDGTNTCYGTLDLKDFYKPSYKSYSGTSVEVLRQIAKELELGFNSNIERSDDSMKWTNTGKTSEEFITEIVKHGYISDSSFVATYIDFYYCLNYVDLEKEWVRNTAQDVCLISTGVASDAVQNSGAETTKLAKFILTNDKSESSTPLYIMRYDLINNSTEKSITKGQFTISKFYDTSSKSFLIFNVDSLTTQNSDNIILKGGPNDKKELETNFRTKFLGRVDMENVHKNYLYAEVQNKTNFDNLSRIGLNLEMPNANFTMYKFQKVNIRLLNPATTLSNPDVSYERLNGDYMVVNIEYFWQSQRMSQRVLVVRKELSKTKEEKLNEATEEKKEEKEATNENPTDDAASVGGIPNATYKVGEYYRAVDKYGRDFSVEIIDVNQNGIEVTANVTEIPKPPPPPPQPPKNEASTQANLDGTGTGTGTGTVGADGTVTAENVSLNTLEKKLLDFIQAKKKKNHSYLGYKVYDVSSADIKKLSNIGKKYGIPLEWLANLINHESAATWNPAIKNGIGATGLIQFLASTAKGYGTTTDQLQKMTFSEQLDYVDKYIEKGTKSYRSGGKIKKTYTQTDLFMTIFYPVSVGKPNYQFPAKVSKANGGIKKPEDYANKACAEGKAPFPPSIVPHDLTSYVKKFGNNIENNNA